MGFSKKVSLFEENSMCLILWFSIKEIVMEVAHSASTEPVDRALWVLSVSALSGSSHQRLGSIVPLRGRPARSERSGLQDRAEVRTRLMSAQRGRAEVHTTLMAAQPDRAEVRTRLMSAQHDRAEVRTRLMAAQPDRAEVRTRLMSAQHARAEGFAGLRDAQPRSGGAPAGPALRLPISLDSLCQPLLGRV
jgi:hypothetical protein